MRSWFDETAQGGSTMDRCVLHAHRSDICFVVTDTRVKEPGSATDANVNMHGCNKDVVGGMSE